MRDASTDLGGPARAFPNTRWSAVLAAAGDAADPLRREALQALLSEYWKPVYATIRRAWGKSNEDAKDLTQEFLARLLESGFFEEVDPAKGSFRAYVRAALRRFLAKAHRDERRMKRGGGGVALPLDGLEGYDPPTARAGESPEAYLDRVWLGSIMARALEGLEAGQRELLGRYDMADPRPTYAELARELEIPETDVTDRLHQARKRYRKAVLALVAETVGSSAEAERELREMLHE